VQYNCPDFQELIAKLAAIVSRYPDKVILAPYPKLDMQIALTAWGRIDTFDEVDEQRIVRFIEAYWSIDHHSRR
jgi:DNA polymerase III delta subunit